ncbi:MAG: Rpn family recombination-promoting nuclease/putative transposase [Spirochaetales bacterium]|nr:Rpn family recombination-promoting nuclease/putative transposase [Spirochaetales bacterium]
MGQFSKRWEDLTIADNFIFCKVMKDEKLCRRMLEVLLGIEVGRIEYLNTENQLENFYDSRGIRLDVYVKDSDRVFNIEMQTGNYDDMLLRTRYYLASSDVSTTKRRTKFKDLKETYILFICKDDPFGAGIPCYTKFSSFLETDKISYDDKSHNVFYNCSAWEKENDPEIREVLKFIYGLKPDFGLALEMNRAASLAKQKSHLEDEYMYFSDILEDEKEEAREIGLAEGRAKGLAEGRAEGINQGAHENAVETAKRLLKMGLTAEQVSEATCLSVEEIRDISK